MAHEIWDNDNFLSVRKPGWHGLGVTLDDYPTREEAQALAHPWEPISEPVFLREPIVEVHLHSEACTPHSECDIRDDFSEEYAEVSGFKAIRRSDDASLLSSSSGGYPSRPQAQRATA